MPVEQLRHDWYAGATVSLCPALDRFEDRRRSSPRIHACWLLTLTEPVFVFLTLVGFLTKPCDVFNSSHFQTFHLGQLKSIRK